jgi:hypothetical protein
MGHDELLPPAVRDLIEQIRSPGERYHKENLLTRLEVIEEAVRSAARDFRRRSHMEKKSR